MNARLFLVVALVCSAIVPSLVSAQEASKSRLIRLTYIRVEPADESAYVKRIREHYIPIHNDRVARGKITSWKAYAVAYPNGEQPEYNFVLMVELPGYAQLELDPSFTENAKKVVGADKVDQVAANPLARIVRTETLVLSVATQGWSTARNRLLNVAYLRSLPGKAPELMAIQRDHYGPATEDMVKDGRMTAWGLGTLRFPEQRDYPYTHLSIGGYDSMAQMEKESSAEHRAKWQAKGAAAMTNLRAVRNRVKGELWRLIEQTTVAGSVTSAR